MTDQEINWEIAVTVDHPHLRECARIGCCPSPSLIPNYCNDLNAMHEAEKTLAGYEQSKFMYELALSHGRTDAWLSIHATARQRAEAFLRTIGKWKEVV